MEKPKPKKRRFHLWESRGRPKRINLLKKSRHIQRWFLRNPWIRPMLTFNLAAIRIQALLRGVIVRVHGKNWRNKIKRKKGRSKQLDKYLFYLDQYSGANSRFRPLWLDDGYSSWCAVRIQSMWRMTLVRRKYLLKRDIYEISALEIQSLYSQHLRHKLPPNKSLHQQEIPPPTQMKTIEAYVKIIQKAWRSYCNIRVYRYLRDIILNKLQGIPADLLRSIIPMETDFLDRAAGIHVRFRLGGMVFPPKIYYKIYTHRPLCDINSFAPRNYTLERKYQPDSATLHNKSTSFSSTYPSNDTNGNRSSFIRKIQSSIRVGRAFYDTTITPPLVREGYDDWYQREDDRNNPWRVISTELEEVLDPPPSWVILDQHERQQQLMKKELKRKKKNDVTSSPNSAYHYSRLRRQQDLLLERKRRKREWMLKAYMLTAGSKGMAGGNDQPPLVQQTNGSGDNDDGRAGSGRGNKSTENETETETGLHEIVNLPRNIEMCDSFSSRSDLIEQQSAQDLSQFDLNKLLTVEKELISNGLQFNYGESDPHLNDATGPLANHPLFVPNCELIGATTDEALLKWSMALDYEEYSKGWFSMATSLPSETTYGLAYESQLKIK